MSFRNVMGAGLLLLGLVLPAPAQTALEWKFKQGDEFFIQAQTKIEQAVTTDGKKTTSSRTFTTVSKFAVTKADAGAYTLEQTIEGVKVESGQADDATVDVASRFAKQIKGAAFKFTINPAGQITSKEIGGYDAFIRRLSGGTEAGEKAARTLYSEDALRQELSAVFGFLPGKPVAKGESWTRSETLVLPWGSLTGEATYTDQGPGKEGEEITVRRKLSYELPKEAVSGMKVTKGSLKVVEARGEVVADPAAGRLVRHTQTTHLTGQLTMTDAAKKDTAFDVDQTTTRTLKRVDKNPLAD